MPRQLEVAKLFLNLRKLGIPWPPLVTREQRYSILQKSPNGNGTATERVFNGYPLNADVALVADPFFQPLLAVVENATGSLICLI